MKKWHYLLFTIILFNYSCKQEPSIAAEVPEVHRYSFLEDNNKLDASLDSLVNQGSVPFLYARIEGANGETIYEHSAVNKELYPDLTLGKDTWFRVWSMSKIITISLAMDLIEEGKLNKNDPVIQFIPEFESLQVGLTADGKSIFNLPFQERAEACPTTFTPVESVMTIEDLLNHKGGFYYPWTGISCLDQMWVDTKLLRAENSDAFIDLLKDLPLLMQPGKAYHYGLNTAVLGVVVERVTGKSLKSLVEERITEPMAIQGLQYNIHDEVLLLPKTNANDSLIEITPEAEKEIFGGNFPKYGESNNLYLGGEGMIATTNGYADFIRMLMFKGELNGNRLLEEKTVEDIASPHTQLGNPWGHNGYNLWVSSDTLRTLKIGDKDLWSGSGAEGTHFWIDNKRQFVGLVMTQLFNMQVSPGDKFKAAVYQEIFGEEELETKSGE